VQGLGDIVRQFAVDSECYGSGLRDGETDLNPGRLRAAVHRAIGLRPGAQRFAAAGGPTAAADMLEQLIITRR
jgi:hypothetical protein